MVRQSRTDLSSILWQSVESDMLSCYKVATILTVCFCSSSFSREVYNRIVRLKSPKISPSRYPIISTSNINISFSTSSPLQNSCCKPVEGLHLVSVIIVSTLLFHHFSWNAAVYLEKLLDTVKKYGIIWLVVSLYQKETTLYNIPWYFYINAPSAFPQKLWKNNPCWGC